MAIEKFGVFGTRTRTRMLLAISIMGETHVQELSRILGVGVSTARNAVDTLEKAGMVAGIVEGNTRRVRLDPRFRAYKELSTLLEKLAIGDTELISAIAEIRRRPGAWVRLCEEFDWDVTRGNRI